MTCSCFLKWDAEALAAANWNGGIDGHLRAYASFLSLEVFSKSWYCDESVDALVLALVVCTFIATACWLLAPLTGDYSFVDRIWSLTPAVFATIFAFKSKTDGVFDPRTLVMALLTWVWGLRLSYNFWRKGGYKLGHEDYRWPVLRKRMSPLQFQIFNFFFIAFYQNWLLLLLAVPAYVAGQAKHTPINWLDYTATVMFLVFFTIEVIADEQQWVFQNAKYAKINAGEALHGDYARGFLTSGLFRYSRHPNFFSEQMIWWSIYLFSVAATGQILNWSALGAALLSMLFQGSTPFTESLSIAKYPAYRVYQQTTSRLMLWWAGPSLDSLKLE